MAIASQIVSETGSTKEPVLRLVDVSFVRDGRTILAPLTWNVLPDQRWIVLGANGSGKTTLLRIAAMYEHPSRGDVRVLGERLGRTDVRVLRRRIGYLSPSLAGQLRPELRCSRRRDDGQVRGAGAVVAPLRRRRRGQGAGLSRSDGRRLARRARLGDNCRRANSSACCLPAR